jgi:hypothetical protein
VVLHTDDRALSWLEESPDHGSLKIGSSSDAVSKIAAKWNEMVDHLQHDTAQGWAEVFSDQAAQSGDDARLLPAKWSRLWRQQHAALGDSLTHADEKEWVEAVLDALDSTMVLEQDHVIRKRLDPKDPVMLNIWMQAHSKHRPIEKFSKEMASKAGHPSDTYWNKIKKLTEADAHAVLWPIITRVLGRKLYTGKNSADITSFHTDTGIVIHGAVTRNLKGNEELEIEQALHAAGIPVEKVAIGPDMIGIELRGEMDEATPDVLGMNEDSSDPYAKERRYYIVKKGSPTNAIPGISGFHTQGAAKKHLSGMKDADQYTIRAIDTRKLPQQELDEAEWSHEWWSPAQQHSRDRQIGTRFGHDPDLRARTPKLNRDSYAIRVKSDAAAMKNIIMQLKTNLDRVSGRPLEFEDGDSLEINPTIAAKTLAKIETLKAPQRHDAVKKLVKSRQAFVDFMSDLDLAEAKYHGKTVKLGKPIRTNTGEGGKFKVYVKDPKSGNIKMVRFGDTTGLSIKRDDPKRRKSFRARHHCENPGPRTKARFWSCRMWTRKPVSKILKGK